MSRRTIRTASVLAGALLAVSAACTRETRYEDPGAVETVNSRFGSTDLLIIAQKMTQSFAGSNAWEGEKPRIVFGGVKNRTQQHIDTTNITDTIRTSLIQSGRFTVLAGDEGIQEIYRETEYQVTDAVDKATAVELGKQFGARYVFYGRFTEIAKEAGSTKSSWLKFTLNAVDVQTRVIVWADEAQILKSENKAFLGW